MRSESPILPLFWIAAAILASHSRAEDPPKPTATEPAVETGLMLVSTTSSPGVYAPVEGAKETVLAPAYVSKYGIRVFSKAEWTERRAVWEDFLASATKEADRIVDTLEPDFKRDARGVIDYALVENPSPWLSSVLLSKRFLPRFEREFGKRLHVIVVDRHRLYVFPADGSKLEGYGEALIDIYQDETLCHYPVSLEVFLVDETGFRAIGSIEQ
ncbi:MAG: hypothetical protein KDL87_08760 [Verrucomicrobiae bacterium]|nr:hypothetical protein [Verrucomicrobiae bacterium]